MIDAKIEKNIITGMIISKRFLQEVRHIYYPLQVSFSKRVADWCLDYYSKYEQPPSEHIQDIFLSNKNEMSEDEQELTNDFLSIISDEYENGEKFNVEYALDSAEKYFRKLSLDNLSKKLTISITKGKIDKAENIVKRFERLTRPETHGINPFEEEIIRKAFSDQSGDHLFEFPDALGDTVGFFEREHLVSFVGVSGIGKSWWLMWMALLGLFEGFKVLYISLEMSEKQIVKRIHQYLNACPTKEYDELFVPVFDCVHNQADCCSKPERTCRVGIVDDPKDMAKMIKYSKARRIKYKPCTNCVEDYEQGIWKRKVKREVLSEEMVLAKNRILYGGLLRKNRFRFIKYPSKGATMADLESHLQNIENYDGFIPDIIVTDMADKFSAEDKRQNTRDQIGEVWESHKRMAQERKCLVVTASQSNTMRTMKDIRQGDWSENIKKIQESDISFALNQQPEEKSQGLMRVTVLKQRDDDFDLKAEINVLMNYKIGRPYLKSYIKK
jgi:hypothetical protein|tara:strand:- start:10795 stop:12291 length:1497 start_codon:yes stop_codon:yes gene_type:complete